MTFICFDHTAEAAVEHVLRRHGLTEAHPVLKTGPSDTDPTVYLSLEGEIPVELREELHAELGSMPGVTIQEGI
jgi:hypothetical protein